MQRTAGPSTTQISLRRAKPEDSEQIADMCAELWPDTSAEEHLRELAPKVDGTSARLLPVALFVAIRVHAETRSDAHSLIGFVEVGLRSHADGCDESHAVGFLEGWFVSKDRRGRGIGRMLVAAAEEWARSKGCKEMDSETWIDSEKSQRAHEAMGYEIVDRCVNYRKKL